MNQSEPNNLIEIDAELKPELTPFQKRRAMAEYKKLLSLIPHGKHKNQRKSAAENRACFNKGKKRLRG